jgi:tRNA pseudouridine55 synthase
VNGLLVIDKPSGITSHDVVAQMRRITGEKSIGHLGTLDPIATGVLPVLLGKYTRLAQYFSHAEKSYTGAMRLGFATDTYDAEGTPEGPDRWPQFSSGVTLGRIRAMAIRFRGDIEQTPPAFSAKKIAGKPAYQLAREGKPVELKVEIVHVSSFVITAMEGAKVTFNLAISAGGYVRSIVHDLGEDLECGAHLTSLRRTKAGVFSIEEAHTLDELKALDGNAAAGHGSAIEALCVHPRTLLPEMPPVTADVESLGRLRNGAQVNLPEFSDAPLVKVFEGQSDLVAIARRVAGTLFQPIVVMV